jgi:hypothetical protein
MAFGRLIDMSPIAQTKTARATKVRIVRIDRPRRPAISGPTTISFKILMVADVAGLFLAATEHPTQHKEPQTP